MLAMSLAATAAVGDSTPLPSTCILEVKTETSTTSAGKERTEIIVVYRNAEGKRKLAYMTKSDHKKMEMARKYGADIEYVLVEGKTRNKITVQ